MIDEKGEKILLDYINATPAMQSLLYDCDLMPEQCEQWTQDRDRMLYIADHWRARELEWLAAK